MRSCKKNGSSTRLNELAISRKRKHVEPTRSFNNSNPMDEQSKACTSHK
jgi:hypothetical protein